MITHRQKKSKLGMAAMVLVAVFSAMIALSPSAEAKQGGKVLTLNVKGTGVAYTDTIPAIDGTGTSEATCFDVELYDLNNGFQIGTATDCLADIIDVHGDGDSMMLVGTTYFNFTGGGQIVTRGKTTVRQILHGENNFTHITGAEPSGGNDILSGSKQFKKAEGSARLSGLVNLSKLGSDGEITFDCVFVINLD